MVLLAGAEGVSWEQSGHAVSRDLPLEVHRIDAGELRDTTKGFHEAYGITPAGAVLVRPDGVVAWRERAHDRASPEELARVLTRLLAREARPA